MPWARIDDDFRHNPKVVAAGPLGIALYVCGLSYCAEHLTDGFIPKRAVRTLVDLDDTDPMTIAQDLVGVGLWEECEGGYSVHDYLKFNPSKDYWAKKQEAGRAGGQASAQARASASAQAEPNPIPEPVSHVPEALSGRAEADAVVAYLEVTGLSRATKGAREWIDRLAERFGHDRVSRRIAEEHIRDGNRKDLISRVEGSLELEERGAAKAEHEAELRRGNEAGLARTRAYIEEQERLAAIAAEPTEEWKMARAYLAGDPAA